MNIQQYRLIKTTLLALLLSIFLISVASADEMTPSSLVFDDATYTKAVEKDHKTLHMLYAKVFDQTLPLGEREKAKRNFFKVSQNLNKKMHSRIMGLNVKEGAALSHTDVLLSTHLLLMTTDMLSSIQQDIWENDPGLQ
jgi:hypothetical protein